MLDAFTFQENLEKNTLLCFLFLYKQTMSMGREATWIRVVVRVIMKGPQIFTTHFGIMAVTNLAQLTALNWQRWLFISYHLLVLAGLFLLNWSFILHIFYAKTARLVVFLVSFYDIRRDPNAASSLHSMVAIWTGEEIPHLDIAVNLITILNGLIKANFLLNS